MVNALAHRIYTADLRSALERALSGHCGSPRRIVELERRPSPYRSSYVLEELDVSFDDCTTLQLIFKDLSRQAMLAGARQAKPAFLYNPLREIETYRSVLATNRLSTPVCYGAVTDHQRARYWLFLEKVSGLKIRHVGDFAIWQQVARWLAVMHSHFAERIDMLARAAHLLNYDAGFYRLWMRRARAFSRHTRLSWPESTLGSIERLAARYDHLIERLMALPVTFIHGDFFASNVIVEETAGALRVCAVDWEMAGTGPGLIDLAALTSGTWTEEQKADLAMAYCDALTPVGQWPPSREEFLLALDCCRLHLAVQWLGWATNWSPPPDEAQDWLSEALRLAEKLCL